MGVRDSRGAGDQIRMDKRILLLRACPARVARRLDRQALFDWYFGLAS